MSGPSKLAPLQAWWAARAPRERFYATLGGVVLGLYLVLAFAVQPAWHTLRSGPAQLEALEAELQAMQRLAAEARELRASPPVSTEQSTAALKAASERLGDRAKLSIQGERAVLTLNGAATGQLRDWLSEVRSGARARPVEANLTRGGSGYSGTIVVSIGGAA